MSFRVPLIAAFVGLLVLMGSAYAYLDAKKADKDAVLSIRDDVRELRTYFLGPPKR